MKKASVTVIGMGYVGLSVALAAAEVGWKVYGLEADEKKVSTLNNLKSSNTLTPEANTKLCKLIEKELLTITTRKEVISQSQVVVICVPTPLDEFGNPDLGALYASINTVARYVVDKTLICLESTVYPGTSENILIKEISDFGANSDLDLYYSFSPERIDPNNLLWDIVKTPKIVSGNNKIALDKAVAFYSTFVKNIVPAKTMAVAELAKLIENSYRLVNVSFVNEILMFARKVGIDPWEAVELAATKPYGFSSFKPSPGAGGHCIPVDPVYLQWLATQQGLEMPLLTEAIKINRSMATYLIERVNEVLSKNPSKILVYGLSYKPNISDTRESASVKFFELATALGHEIKWYDAHVDYLTKDNYANLTETDEIFDLTVIFNPPQNNDLEIIKLKSNLLFDCTGTIKDETVKML